MNTQPKYDFRSLAITSIGCDEARKIMDFFLHTWKLQMAQLNDEVHRLKETNNRLIYELNKERIKNRENADV